MLPSVSHFGALNLILTAYLWGEGAIGTARYTGVSLKKVLKYCGGPKDGATDVEFQGVDTYFKKGQVFNYVVSVPYRKARFHASTATRCASLYSGSLWCGAGIIA